MWHVLSHTKALSLDGESNVMHIIYGVTLHQRDLHQRECVRNTIFHFFVQTVYSNIFVVVIYTYFKKSSVFLLMQYINP